MDNRELGKKEVAVLAWVLARWELLMPPTVAEFEKRFKAARYKTSLSDMRKSGYVGIVGRGPQYSKFVVPLGLAIRFKIIKGSRLDEALVEPGFVSKGEYLSDGIDGEDIDDTDLPSNKHTARPENNEQEAAGICGPGGQEEPGVSGRP